MKHHKTSDIGPYSLDRGTGSMVIAGAREALKRANGGIPPNLQVASRPVLLRVIKDLSAENERLRAGANNSHTKKQEGRV